MDEKKNLTMSVADAEAVQAIRDFLSEYYTVSDLFEQAANAGSVMLGLVNCGALAQDEVKYLSNLIDQHVMLANLMKPFEKVNDDK